MGCKTCKSSASDEANLSYLINAIDQDNAVRVEEIIKSVALIKNCSVSELLKKPIINFFSLTFNIPCYTVWMGKTNTYHLLVNKFSLSIYDLEDYFLSMDTNTLSVLCQKGHLEILKHYIRVFTTFQNRREKKDANCSITSIVDQSPTGAARPKMTPIQLACFHEQIHIIHFLQDFFSLSTPPASLDVHYIEENTGENCALISLKSGNYVMIKFLYEAMNADFHIKNANNEGAFQILATTSKKTSSAWILQSFQYLIDVVKVDLTYMYEETLIILENRDLISYFEGKLRENGIVLKKKELESFYKIKPIKTEEGEKESKNNTASVVIGQISELSIVHSFDVSLSKD